MTTIIDAAKIQKPVHDSVFCAAYMWFRLRSAPVVITRETWITMKRMNQHSTKKCRERETWMLRTELTQRRRVDSAGDIPRPDSTASGAAMNTVTKYAINCRLL